MFNSCIQLNDLPDEILISILKKLKNTEVLYSLIGVDKRLSTIAHDSIFTSYLTLMVHSTSGSYDRLPDKILDRFCLEILPKVHHKIQRLNLESSSIERILLSTNYPNLYGLSLYDLEVETAKNLLTDKTSLIDKFKNQISLFAIDITKNEKRSSTENVMTLIFAQIFTKFIKLKYLNFSSSLFYPEQLSFSMSSPTVSSSILLELHVNLQNVTDCFYLLDGRFNKLRTLYVNTTYILPSSLVTMSNNKENLPNLRCFSLYCNNGTDYYDRLILPLLHLMSNLEKLCLYVIVNRRNAFIDGNQLKTNIINNMPRLNKFTFNIISEIHLSNQIDLPSNEDIQRTFKTNRIISYVDYFSKIKIGRCHIYSYPYKWKEYNNITNNFPGGLFKYVRKISLYDERPFEHKFFLRISQSFPLLEKLTLINKKRQSESKMIDNRDLSLSISEYFHLTEIDLTDAHRDYLEEFLLDRRTCLPNNVYIYINYRPMKKITQNFTRDATRINCSKVNFIYGNYINRLPKHFEDYFLHTYRSLY